MGGDFSPDYPSDESHLQFVRVHDFFGCDRIAKTR